ncbi:MAG: DUF4870 domain-containing protein [Pseudomonadota bacterium]
MTDHEPSSGTSLDSSSSDALERQANQWGMFIHFGILAGFVVPFAGLVVPIVLWQMKKDELPRVDAHGKVVVNWMLSSLIYGLVCGVLTLILIGALGFLALGIATVIFAIVGGIKANDGEIWEYPASIRFLK